MKFKILGLSIFLIFSANCFSAWDPTTVELTRSFSKEVFEANGMKYMQPLANALNSTSNSRFFNQAYVPRKAKGPYFKLSVNGMMGFVRDDQKTYKPSIPFEPFDTAKVIAKLSEYGTFGLDANFKPKYTITGDTAQLLAYIFKVYTGEALRRHIIDVPEFAPTILGAGSQLIDIKKQLLLDSVVRIWPSVGIGPYQFPIYSLLDSNVRKKLDSTVLMFPQIFTLPTGGDFTTLIAGIPQLEIGSLFGTEALIRYIPLVNMGAKIGNFSFWGFGLKHSISQYFGETRYFDMAVQAVYQGTYLKNTVPQSGAELEASATIWDFNIQASKNLWNVIDIYTGLSYETLKIQTDYKYYLPVETQMQLGLLERAVVDGVVKILPPDPARGYPGDTKPQNASFILNDVNIKWTIGARGNIGPFGLYFDYSISRFNIFSAGLEFNINKIYNAFSTGNFFNDGNYIEKE